MCHFEFDSAEIFHRLHFEFDHAEIFFRMHFSMKFHILSKSKGLAIWHGFPDNCKVKINKAILAKRCRSKGRPEAAKL